MSIEGYWYWLGTDHPMRNELRRMSGKYAKDFGRRLKRESEIYDPDFQHKIKKALLIKLISVPEMLWQLVDLKLPLTHYYFYGGRAIEPNGCEWLTEFYESLKGRTSIWDWHELGLYAVITTNKQVRKDGNTVMGAGLAKQAAERFPELPAKYAKDTRNGNYYCIYNDYRLILVPTKDDWRQPSTLELVAAAVEKLKQLPKSVKHIAVPALGCKNGQLKWSSVRPIMETLPKNRFLVIPPKED